MKDNIILMDIHLHIICLMIVNRSVDSDMIFTAQCRSSLNIQYHVCTCIHVPSGGTNDSPTHQILLSGTIILVHCATMFASDWGTVYHDNYALMIGRF